MTLFVTLYHFFTPIKCAELIDLGVYVLKMSSDVQISLLALIWQRCKVSYLSEKSMRIIENHWKTTENHQKSTKNSKNEHFWTGENPDPSLPIALRGDRFIRIQKKCAEINSSRGVHIKNISGSLPTRRILPLVKKINLVFFSEKKKPNMTSN